MSPLWSSQRWMVDRARHLLARAHRPPALPRSGPLVRPGATAVLATLADRPLPQPDPTSCGSSSLTLMRMLRDHGYAAVVLRAAEPARVFGVAALGVRRRTNALVDARGRLQLPWPARLGVRPAAMVRLLNGDAAFGATGPRYRTVDVDPVDPGPAYDATAAQVRAGEPVPLYVGDGRWMRHIVLVVGAREESLIAYDPACGYLVAIPRAAFVRDAIEVAGWTRPWLVVLAARRAK